MPRAVDPPGRYPKADFDPTSADLLFNYSTMPRFDWLAWVKKMLHDGITWLTNAIYELTGGRIDLGPLHEALDEVWADFVAGIGTGANLTALFKTVARIIEQATGVDLTHVFMVLLPALLDLLNNLAAIAGAGGQAIHELIMLPLNILDKLRRIFAGEQVDWSDLPELFAPIVAAFAAWWSIIGTNLPEAIDNAKQALWYIAELLWRLGTESIANLADKLTSVIRQAISPLNTNLWGQIRGAILPSRHVADPEPELLDNPSFIGDISISMPEQWSASVSPGAWRVVADGRPKTLVSNPIQVTAGMIVPVSIQVNYAGVAATANQNAIRLSVNRYDADANLLGTTMLAAIASPAGTANNVTLAGTYTASGEAVWIAVRLDVTAAASSGTIFWHHATTKSAGFTTPQIADRFVQGIAGIFDIGSATQNLWDSLQNAVSTAGIPGITAPGLVTGASLSQVAQSMHELAVNVANSLTLNRQTRIELGLVTIEPRYAEVTAVGAHVIPLPPDWSELDYCLLGAGGAGGAMSTFFVGGGGQAGQWLTGTLRRGVNVAQNAASVTITVSAGGTAYLNQGGGTGGATTLLYTDAGGVQRTLTAYGGAGGALYGGNSTGIGPGTMLFRGNGYFGGTNVGGHANGSPPGGGGGGGYTGIGAGWGGVGAAGAGYVRIYGEESP